MTFNELSVKFKVLLDENKRLKAENAELCVKLGLSSPAEECSKVIAKIL